MALQHRLRPGPDGDAGRRRADGPARQPEGRAAAPGRARGRQRRPSAGVRAALFALLDHDLRAVGGPAAGADPDELAAAARPARPCRDAAPAAPHRAHLADRHAARRAPDLPQARRGGARPRLDDAGLEARRSRGAGAARADRLGRGELHPARLSLHRGGAQFRRRRPPLLPGHRASRAARPSDGKLCDRQHRRRRRHDRPRSSTPTASKARARRSRCSPSRSSARASTSRATTSCCASCRATCCRRSRRRCAPPASPTPPT